MKKIIVALIMVLAFFSGINSNITGQGYANNKEDDKEAHHDDDDDDDHGGCFFMFRD